MPNYCDYEMKIVGSKRAINRVMACLKQHYNYPEEGKPAHKHFFRVFEAYSDGMKPTGNKNEYEIFIGGDVAWSIHSAMVDKSPISYYAMCKENHKDIFMGTTLFEQSKGCKIEVFSEEPGCMFSEHYLFDNGKCIIDECVELIDKSTDDEFDYINPNKTYDHEGDTEMGDNPGFYDFTI